MQRADDVLTRAIEIIADVDAFISPEREKHAHGEANADEQHGGRHDILPFLSGRAREAVFHRG
jgi:hypothetical protein